MKKLRYIISDSTNPYQNIALEEYLLLHTRPEECVLYLWQNRKTVVIGYNQNAWKECRVEELEADGGFLARRLSGGGAVFHDLGNLNFTFLVRKDSYSVERQTEVILRAVRSFGMDAVRTGRNDLTVEGRKFSGNAFYRSGDFCYHHGTILIQADKQEMARYLNVSREKLQSKGVESVKSRVENLTQYQPSLTVEQMQKALLAAFAEVYGGIPEAMAKEEIPAQEWKAGEQRFSSWDWLYGRKLPFNFEVTRRFAWGEVLVRLEISEGMICNAAIWTDALDTELPRRAERALEGCRYRGAEIAQRLQGISQSEEQGIMLQDLAECLAAEDRQQTDAISAGSGGGCENGGNNGTSI